MTFTTNELLEFGALKQILTKFTDSPLGAQCVDQMAPLSQRIEIQKHFDLLGECLKFVETGHELHFTELGDFSPLFQKLAIEGVVLTPKEILEISSLLLCSQSTKKLLQTQGSRNLAEMGGLLPELKELASLLLGKISHSGEVEDHASPRLKKIRSEIGVIRNRLYHSLGQILKKHTESRILQDDLITIRNERYVIPVRVESRKELAGVVHGMSSSGATVFLEPLEVLELNNQLVRLKDQADSEIHSILLSFSDKIRECLTDLLTAARLLGTLDFTFAKVRFYRTYQCVLPEINEGGVLTIVEGRHPILEKTLLSQGMKIVPISIDLDGSRHVLVISGPNTGGKTVALKTVGLLTLMALSGIPVPAAAANIGVFHQVLADIGDHQSISENLSTFSSHLLNIKEILERVSPPALVLLDELGAGTDPAEGSALGVAIVERLRAKGVMTVLTTHHNGLKMYASKTPKVSNASVEFDEATLRPTFRLIHGTPGHSSGIEMARRLGLDDSLVSHAQRLIAKEEQEVVQYSQYLRAEIARNARVREQFEGERRDLEGQRKCLEVKYRELEEQKRKEIEQSWKYAFERFEKETRKLISEIQDKYMAVRARREIERKTAKLQDQLSQEVAGVSGVSNGESVASSRADSPIVPGSKVVVKKLGQAGSVAAVLKDGRLEVAVGNLKCVVARSELELNPEIKSSGEEKLRLPAQIKVQVNSPEPQTNEINLIGCTVDEAISRADKFLDMAFMASIPEVRLIHGCGRGILRKAISEWLSGQPHVGKFQAAEANQGGNGVTLVSLKV